MSALLLALACAEDPSDTGQLLTWEVSALRPSQRAAPHSTLAADVTTVRLTPTGEEIDLTERWVPVIQAPHGAQVELAPYPQEDTFAEHLYPLPEPLRTPVLGWQAPDGLEPGAYTVLGVQDPGGQLHAFSSPVALEVQSLAADLDGLEAGQVWEVEDWIGDDWSRLALSHLEFFIRVAAVRSEQVDVELLASTGGPPCGLVALSMERDGAELRWSRRALTLPVRNSEPIALMGLELRLPISEGGEIAAGRAQLLAEAAGLDAALAVNNPEWEAGDLCALTGTCLPCSDPDLDCLPVHVSDIWAAPLSSEALAAFNDQEIPSCQADAQALPALDCGCTTAAGFSSLSLGWLALALVRTRRRKKRAQRAQDSGQRSEA